MKDPNGATSNDRHANFLKSLSTFSKGHAAANWSGTFGAFLESIFPKDPAGIVRSSHQYIWDLLRSEGFADDKGQLHCRLFDDELYGIEETLDRVVDYFKAAASGSDVGRRLLLLLGPPSGGKSTMAILLKRGLEEYSHTDEGAMYGLQGSPMRQTPVRFRRHHAILASIDRLRPNVGPARARDLHRTQRI